MRQQTLAETLRAYFEADAAYAVAEHAMQHTIASEWTDDERAQYLRGYDDAKAEAAHVEMLLREAQDELANANARVQQLAAELAVRMTVPETQPAAVGVVGAVIGYAVQREHDGVLISGRARTKKVTDDNLPTYEAGFPGMRFRVVAIVDPDAIVPLASGTAARWRHDQLDRVWHHRDLAACAGYGTVSPLYPGLAQPAQERDA
jgi:hypothetical protein